MAGLIDFGLLGAGVDYGQIARAYTDGRAQKADRQLREAQVARQTKLDARDDAQFASRETAGKQIAAGDIAGAETTALGSGDTELYSQIKSLSAAQRKEAADHADIIGGAAIGLKGVPQEQRAASFAAMRPILKARGLTDAEIDAAAAKLDDQSLDAYAASALTVKDAIAKAADDRKFGLEKDKFGHTVENDAEQRRLTARGQDITVRGQDRAAADAAAGRAVTLRGQNLTDARSREANAQGGKPPAGYRWGANNSLVAIPGGPADTSATGGKPLTEAQSKATSYYGRALMTDKIISGGKNIPGSGARFADNLPLGVGSAFISSDDQTQLGARRGFIAAVLRQESGAAISPSEFSSYDNLYFPQPNDSKANIAQKAKLRAQAVRGLAVAAGPGAAQMAEEPRSSAPRNTERVREAAGGTLTRAKGGVRVWTPGGR